MGRFRNEGQSRQFLQKLSRTGRGVPVIFPDKACRIGGCFKAGHLCVLLLVFLLSIVPVQALEMSDITMPSLKKDAKEREAEYIHNVQKQEVKEEHERRKMNRNPSGFMTVEEYEMLSAPKDKTQAEIEIPKLETPSDMKYIPQPTYKIVRYNNPPGSPEISLKRGTFHNMRQQNAQGIASPDFQILVYPSVYYYPSSAAVACDLFVIPLEQRETNLNKIMKANVMHRWVEPILSTDKSIRDSYSFRTLTPVDFSADGTKLLVKEKVGYSDREGIWQTNAIVYDFNTKTSYNLVELRDAVVYYWKEYRNVNLDDKRWDLYPLGFDINEPDRVISYAYAYTGDSPVFLGSWSIDSHGEQARLISFTNKDVQVSMNGFKIVQDGVIPPDLLKNEEKAVKKYEKSEAKRKKAEEKAELKQMDAEYKQKIKEMDEAFKKQQKDYKMQDKLQGSTSQNDTVEKYDELKAKQEQKAAAKAAKKQASEARKKQKELAREVRRQEKLKQKQQKELEKQQKNQES